MEISQVTSMCSCVMRSGRAAPGHNKEEREGKKRVNIMGRSQWACGGNIHNKVHNKDPRTGSGCWNHQADKPWKAANRPITAQADCNIHDTPTRRLPSFCLWRAHFPAMPTPDVAEADSIQLISYLVYKCLIDMKHRHWHTRICVCVPVWTTCGSRWRPPTEAPSG